MYHLPKLLGRRVSSATPLISTNANADWPDISVAYEASSTEVDMTDVSDAEGGGTPPPRAATSLNADDERL